VRVAVSLASEVSYAVKIMTMPKEGAAPVGDGATRQEIVNEVQILAKVQHPNCLRYKVCVCLCSSLLRLRGAAAWGGVATPSLQACSPPSRRVPCRRSGSWRMTTR
jgi:hypothetical protein